MSKMRVKKSGKMWVRMMFTKLTKKQREHLFLAEKELHKAGISFDTGYDFGAKRRDWELDWSLKGATIECREIVKK